MNNCFSKIQLVGQKNIETKHVALVNGDMVFDVVNPFPSKGFPIDE